MNDYKIKSINKIVEDIIKTGKIICNQYEIEWNENFFQWVDNNKEMNFDFFLNIIFPIINKRKFEINEVTNKIIKNFDSIEGIKIENIINGYINISILNKCRKYFLAEVLKNNNFEINENENENIKVNIEYVSANPTGDLHIGNFRHAVIGNCLSKIYKFMGYKVTREYYINDKGNQIDCLAEGVYNEYLSILNIDNIEKNNSYEKLLKKSKEGNVDNNYKSSKYVANKLFNDYKDYFLLKGEVSGKKKIEIIYEEFKKKIVDILVKKIKEELEMTGINFDIWTSEKDLYKNENFIIKLLEDFKEKKIVYEREGALFFSSSLYGDDKDRVILKSNGDYTYFFSDIIYQKDKIRRNYDIIIMILGSDHHGYIKRIKIALNILKNNLKKEKNNFYILTVQNVGLINEGNFKKFSKRSGNIISLNEILRYFNNEKEEIKFFLLEKNPNQTLKIDIELLKNNKENTRIYYVQYAHARSCQIINKSKDIYKKGDNILPEWNEYLLNEKIERKIINLLIKFPFILKKIIKENNPSLLVNYLLELSKFWQYYYQNFPILENENKELRNQRIILTRVIELAIKESLDLIGIKAKEKL